MWFQSPEYLLWSRKQLLSQQNTDTILSALNITKDTRVLDVGCGSGELIRRISDATGCQCVGLDLDETLITYAKQFETERLTFFLGNAIEMPFEDSAFDIVISHTFFTTIFDAESALAEMQRVCKQDGVIAAINAETVDYIPHYKDSLSACEWFVDYSKYKLKTGNLYYKKSNNFAKGLRPELIPQLFIDSGLQNVDVLQLGKFFSIGSRTCTKNDRLELIELDYQVEASLSELLDADEREEYLKILQQKKEYLLQNSDYFDWTGGASLMVIADNRKNAAAISRKQKDYRFLNDMEAMLAAKNVKVDFSSTRADVGSVSTVELTAKEQGVSVVGAGFTPMEATLCAYAKLLCEINEDDTLMQTVAEQIVSHIFDEESAQKLSQKLKAFGLEKQCAKWCLPKTHTALAYDREEAIQEAMYDALATFAMKRLIEEQLRPTSISCDRIWEREVIKCIHTLRRYGYNVELFDISCGSDIPAVAACAFDEKGAVLKYAADFDVGCAVRKCLAAVLEGKKINSLTAGALRIVSGAMPDRETFNLMTTGQNILPESFIKPCETSDLHVFVKHENVLKAQEALCRQQSLNFRLRTMHVASMELAEVIVPDAKMIWKFSRKRMDELFFSVSVRKMISGIKSAADVHTLASYMEQKLQWSKENQLSFLTDAKLSVPVLGVELDYRLLLASCYIAEKKYDKAAQVLPTYNQQLQCLKHVLKRSNFEMLKKLYGVNLVANAQIFIFDPLGSIE